MSDYAQAYGFSQTSDSPQSNTSQDYSSEYGFTPSQENINPSLNQSQGNDNVISNAEKQIGSQDYNGWCETWQEKMTGSPNMGGTAVEAWQNYAQQGKAYQGLQGAKPGDKIYFSGDGGYGHTGIITSIDPQTGDATFISATDNGVKEHSVNNWLQSTGQQLLGFVQ